MEAICSSETSVISQKMVLFILLACLPSSPQDISDPSTTVTDNRNHNSINIGTIRKSQYIERTKTKVRDWPQTIHCSGEEADANSYLGEAAVRGGLLSAASPCSAGSALPCPTRRPLDALQQTHLRHIRCQVTVDFGLQCRSIRKRIDHGTKGTGVTTSGTALG
jgi:hypothetical protein